jgi:membrane fusion protein (multidrug efflux system)
MRCHPHSGVKTVWLLFVMLSGFAGVLQGTDGGLELEGITLPRQRVSLSLPMEARLTRLLVEEGQRVVQGQQLAVLYSATEELDCERAEALLKRAEFQYESKRKLKVGQGISDAEMVGAEADREVARIELGRSRAVLRDKTLVAPWSGTVLRVLKGVGETVNRGEKVVELVDLSSVNVDVYVEAGKLGMVREGQEAEVTGDGSLKRGIKGTVQMVDPVVDPGSGLSRVRLMVVNSEGQVLAGMPVRVRFLPGQELGKTERVR